MNELSALLDPATWASPAQLAALIRVALTLLVGLILARALGQVAERGASSSLAPERAALLRRGVQALIVSMAAATALQELGFDLTVLLGAAGVLTVAVGFASQTSASNLISGLFLVAEKPFSVGDVVTIATTTGEVLAIDTLSVKLRTFDNLYVRIPNETVMKAEITNVTRFPVRRIDVLLSVDRAVDVASLKARLIEVADVRPTVLDEPRPDLLITGFGPQSVELRLSAWAAREVFFNTRIELQAEVRRTLLEMGAGSPRSRVLVESPDLSPNPPD